MHEFSLAREVIDLAEREAERNNALSVCELTIEVGIFSGVEADALQEALHLLADGTILSNTSVNIVRLNGRGMCQSCHKEFEMDHRLDNCPVCGSYPGEISGGKEFRVVSLVIEQDDRQTSSD